ncbi:uncharacterized protein LOC134795161 [Cydia splendana]|uniref:uncharacterized protein LOC134795161 n=1 Tax=Cydia splendana TaxID=1100963 RepID=UPI00300D3170
MEHYFCITLLTFGAYAQNLDYIEIPASSARIVENVPDQNTAGGHINTNYFGGIGEPDYYGDNYGNKYNGKYFGRDVEDILINRKLSDVEKLQRSRGLYEHYEYDDGNPDVQGRIQRPCQAYDTFCIRKFFAQHSQCKISGRQVPEPLFRAQATLNYPNSNVSATFNNLEYRGIKDGRMCQHRVVTATGNGCMGAVDFDQVTFASQTLYLKYYLRGREPVVVQDAGGATFVQVSVTAVIPNLKNLKLDRAEIFTYNGDPVPPFLAGPRLALSTGNKSIPQNGRDVRGALNAYQTRVPSAPSYLKRWVYPDVRGALHAFQSQDTKRVDVRDTLYAYQIWALEAPSY